ncbi:MAG TPA: phosphatidylserine decarboxylase, partial [Clostridiaceae bacterium]|nr:phosphatidylserine decarboxylase [Clostridiaceae bacterium]
MIKFYNRKTGEYEIEKVSAQRAIKWSYESHTGMGFLELIFKKRCFSRFIGWYFNRSISKRQIKKFIKIYNINTNELIKSPEEFTCFNDFFIRGLKENAREVDYSPEAFISPCDSKVLAYENASFDDLFEIKGFKYTIPELINNAQITSE